MSKAKASFQATSIACQPIAKDFPALPYAFFCRPAEVDAPELIGCRLVKRQDNSTLQVRVRIDGTDAFINRLGRWDDPVAVAKAHAISAQIWSDYQQWIFDRP